LCNSWIKIRRSFVCGVLIFCRQRIVLQAKNGGAAAVVDKNTVFVVFQGFCEAATFAAGKVRKSAFP
jgi:hypothetical protein